ncbi:hypothetical protein [Butyrivibrio sp. WCE2006]|uniref:hypothetical protein n=1 Tax=Butyrivibrio sp. WCE2006 TaxID=1410611 RepID=UPI0005D202DD|nr:hypothetical protein [Butyrivibrio sp. WCE2006]
MLKTLVKKQIFEVFKSYFYDAKRNRMRSKPAIAAWIVFFVVIMVGILGGIFLGLSFTMCGSLVTAGIDWMYYLIMGCVAVFLGSFGSVYNSYASLYLAKDNELLLAMPIPVRDVIGARLINVYLLGVMYMLTVLIPADIVYFVLTGINVTKVIGAVLFFLCISAIVMLISCGLGFVIAKISLRLKNKSLISVFVTLAGVVAYFTFYFRAGDIVKALLLNAPEYAAFIKRYAYVLYLFGCFGAGSLLWAGVFTTSFAGLCMVIFHLILKSFISIATTSGKMERVAYKVIRYRQKAIPQALLWKEFQKFITSPTYMLNCGLGIILMPAAAVFMMIKGRGIIDTLNEVFVSRPGSADVLICTGIIFMAAMVDTAMPSVSLEGKSLWILKTMPASAGKILSAKALLQIILSVPPALILSLCTGIIADESALCRFLIIILPLSYAAFAAVLETAFAVKMPILEWTNENVPVKQCGAAFITVISFWAVSILFAGGYMLVGYHLGAEVYLLAWELLFVLSSIAITKWLDTEGARIFAELN